MNSTTSYRFSDLSGDSRIWIYLSDRLLTDDEQHTIQIKLDRFTDEWTSHDQQLKAEGKIVADHLIILAVDQSRASASGCSIDKSVHFMQALGHQLSVDFFNRQNCLVELGEERQLVPLSQLSNFLKDRDTKNCRVFDTLIQSNDALSSQFNIPLSQSWHRNFVDAAVL